MNQENFERLIYWLKEYPDNDNIKSTISNNLEVINDDLMGRCIKAKDKIERNYSLIKIPKSFLLNYVTSLKYLAYFNDEVNDFLKLHIQNFNREKFKTESDEITKIYSNLDLRKIITLSSHQLLTLFICLENKRKKNSFWFPLLNCFPKLEEYSNIPMTWNLQNSTLKSKQVFNMLPQTIINHTKTQLTQFYNDIDSINNALNKKIVDISEDEYLWSWLAINTRCLYYKLPNYLPITSSKEREASNITLVPFVDLINHKCNDPNAIAKETKFGYEVLSRKKIFPNDHLWFSYGPHNDEFLQCEYGFSVFKIGDNNKIEDINIYNTIDITSILIKLLNKPKKKNVSLWLKQTSYYGDYTLGIDSILKNNDNNNNDISIIVKPSHRTRIVLASLVENDNEFIVDPIKSNNNNFLIRCPLKLERFYEGYNDGEYYKNSELILLNKIISKLKDDINGKLEKLSNNQENENFTKITITKKILESQLFLLNSF